MSSLELVHIHGFKCAGTTFSASLAANYLEAFRCIEPRAEAPLEWRAVLSLSKDLELKAISSHSLRIPQKLPSDCVFVHLIRDPTARWISGWNFETNIQKNFNGTFSEYLKSQSFNRNLQSRFLVEDNSYWELQSMSKDEFSDAYFSHKPNIFFGLVERYDESMTVLEDLLSRRSVSIDLSYPSKLNTSEKSSNLKVPDVRIPNDFIDLDSELYKFANFCLDLHISLIPNFHKRLNSFKNRCAQKQETLYEFEARITNEKWHYLG